LFGYDVLSLRCNYQSQHKRYTKVRTDTNANNDKRIKRPSEERLMSKFWKLIIIDIIYETIKKLITGGKKNGMGTNDKQKAGPENGIKGNENQKMT
jgi:hypothetical protein